METELRSSAKLLGELLPVIVNQNNEVVDGRHRLKANPRWKREKIQLDDLQTHLARLVINTIRRTAETADYVELAAFLVETQGTDQPYKLKSGKAVVDTIAELTGIPRRTVFENLEVTRFVRKKSHNGSPANIGKSERLTLPEQIAKPAQQITDQIQKIIAIAPDQKPEILQRVETAFADLTGELKEEVEKEKQMKELHTKLHKEAGTEPVPIGSPLTLEDRQQLGTLLHKEEQREKTENESSLTVKSVGNILDVTNRVQSPLNAFSFLLSYYSCPSCKQEHPLDTSKMRFSAPEDDMPKVEDALKIIGEAIPKIQDPLKQVASSIAEILRLTSSSVTCEFTKDREKPKEPLKHQNMNLTKRISELERLSRRLTPIAPEAK